MLVSAGVMAPSYSSTRIFASVADGGAQVVLDGVPLCDWRNDLVPGDATGDGVGGNWDVARP